MADSGVPPDGARRPRRPRVVRPRAEVDTVVGLENATGVGGTVARALHLDGPGSGDGGSDPERGIAPAGNPARSLRETLAACPLDQQFWLKVADRVLEMTSEAMTPETVTMLATCSDQVNKAKVLGGKGLSETDPLKFLRDKLDELTGGTTHGEA